MAIADYYYRTDEVIIKCPRCGYNYNRYFKWNRDHFFNCASEIEDAHEDDELIIDEQEGFGVYVLRTKDGYKTTNLYNCRITNKHIDEFKKLYFSEETDQERSYLVRYEEGEFKVIIGTLPEDFFTYSENTIQPYILRPLWKLER